MSFIRADSVTIGAISLQGSTGLAGESIYNDGVNQLWLKQNKSALFVDSTDMTQDLNTAPPLSIGFDTIVYNNIDLVFDGKSFTFNTKALYSASFECMLSNSDAQSMISFFINGNPVYGNLSMLLPSGNPIFYSSYILDINPGDVLEIVGQKYNGGPSFLMRNPIYQIPVTKLEIITL
jgi:hypothetical protein